MSAPCIAVIGGQTEPARSLLAGVVRYRNLHTSWQLLLNVWIGLPPLMELAGFDGAGLLYLGPDTYPGAPPAERTLAQIARLKLPVVYATVPGPRPLLPCVIPADYAAGELAARHLLERHLRHLALFAYEDSAYSPDRRTAGFRDAVAAAGRTCSVYTEPGPWCSTPWAQLQARLARWLAELPKPLGLAVLSDARAAFVLHTAREAGIAVPDELAVVAIGANDPLICQCAQPALSAVDPGNSRIGYAAAQLLHKLLRGEPAPKQPVLIPPLQVVERRSSEFRSLADPLVARCLTYLDEHLTDGPGVGNLLRLTELSPRSLELRFRKALGLTPAAQIRRLQIHRAKQLLTDTDLPMPDIAAACGLPSATRLSVVFARLEQTTPTLYRRRCRGEAGRGKGRP